MTALSDLENVGLVVVDEGDTPPIPELATEGGMSETEAYRFLADVPEDESLIADGGSYTTGMIALLPSVTDQERLALASGEPAGELHVTLWYLGEVASYDESLRGRITSTVAEIALEQSPLAVTGFGVSVWNPESDSPALVLNVGGPGLVEAHDEVGEELRDIWSSRLPEQHCPWQPHVCLAYGADLGSRVVEALTRVGPLRLDRIRVAFGDAVTDIPLGYVGSIVSSATSDAPEVTMAGNESDAVPTDAPTASGVGGVGNADLPDATGLGLTPSVELATLPDGRIATWEGILVVEGTPTGDGREFAIGSLSWPAEWTTLRWAPEDNGQHLGAVDVGRIDRVWRDTANPAIIRAVGVFNVKDPTGLRAYENVSGEMLKGVSVDVDAITSADVELVWPVRESDVEDSGSDDDTEMSGPDIMDMLFGEPELTRYHAGRIRGATLVALPAFVEAQIRVTTPKLGEDATPVTHDDAALVAAVDRPWDVDDARRRANIMRRSGGSAWAQAAVFDIMHHHVRPGEVGPANVAACLAGLVELRESTQLGSDLKARRLAYAHLAAHLRTAGYEVPPFTTTSLTAPVRHLVACGGVEDYEAPPAAHFENPRLPGKTPLTIDGTRIFGHAATWGTPHIGFQTHREAPRDDDFIGFHLGEVITAEGTSVATGTITMDTGHASVSPSLRAEDVVAHYDNTGTVVADVVVGNDEFGIWFSGALRHGLSRARIASLRAAKLSGDWRARNGRLSLVALLAVNVPGFAIPRTRAHVAYGAVQSLVAAGIVSDSSSLVDMTAIAAMKQRLARRIGRDPDTRRRELRTRVHPTAKA